MVVDVEKHLIDLGVDYVEGSKRFTIVCPFHNDSSPSCGVWKESGYFRCFGCGREGSFVELLSELGDMPLAEARRLLRGEDRISDMEDRVRTFLHEDDDKLKYFSYSAFSKIFPPVAPKTPAWDYLIEQRHLTESTIRRFDIRRGEGKYRNRVVVPIFTVDGKLLSYVGRAIKKGMVPKTRKSRSPHRTFFGLHEIIRDTQSTIRRSNLVVVEGEFDAMYLQQFGVRAVSNMGSAPFGPAKLVLVRRYASKLTFMFDGDEAGRKAMDGDPETGKMGLLRMLSPHVPTTSIRLPEGMDPDDLSEEQIREMFGGGETWARR